jgi:parvulin-like peptidyl-prolyl isomerase
MLHIAWLRREVLNGLRMAFDPESSTRIELERESVMSRRTMKDNSEPVSDQRLSRSETKKRQLRALLFSIAAIIILAVAGAMLYQIYLAPFRKPVVTIDNTVIRMQYFLDRARMTGDPGSTIQQLADEEIVKLGAKELGITIPESEIDRVLHEAAGAAATDNSTQLDVSTRAGFDAWYRGLLKESGLSNAQYRDMVRTNMIVQQMQTVIASNVPDKGEQVHLNLIVLNRSADALAAKARLDKGEDFAAVAKAVSVDTQSRGLGGDIGWWPHDILPYDDTVFQLAIGQVSDPVMSNPNDPSTTKYLLFKVSEKDPDRTLEGSAKMLIAQTWFKDWLEEQRSKHEITYNLTAEDQAWVQYELAKVRR